MLRPKGFDKLDHYFRTQLEIDLTDETIEMLLDAVKDTFGKLFYKAEERARFNGRDFIAMPDLNVTLSLEEHIKNFKKIEEDMGVDDLLEYIAFIPPVGMPVGEDLKSEYRNILGGLLLMYADVIKKATGERKPSTTAMEFVRRVVDQVF
ncbi:MAG: DUF1931 family protein [Aquificae bacterium]|jgi:hypothetical protein|nr:DUF1931 family protein [Aquificota bacterium]